VASYLVLLTALISREVCAQQQPAPVKVEEVAHEGELLQSPNNFSLAVDAADYVLVGGANSNNVVRIAPRGDLGRQGDAPCVAEILSETKALQDGHAGQPSCPMNPPVPGFEFRGPKGLAVSSDGSVYVTGTGGSSNMCDNVVRIAPDGTIDELVNRNQLGLPDWNPAGLALDAVSGVGVYVYAAGPAPTQGATVRINPDGTAQQILNVGGQGVVTDGMGNVYLAQIGSAQVTLIPDARSGVCGVDGKQCSAFILGGGGMNGTLGCDGQPVTLAAPYALAVAGGILYVTDQSSNVVLRRPLQPDNALQLPLCVDQIFSDGEGGLALKQPRAIAADSSGNVYVAGTVSNNVIWIKPAAPGSAQTIAQEIISGAQNGLNKPEALALDSHGNVYVSGNLDAVSAGNVFRIRTVTAGLNPTCGNGILDKNEACDYSLSCCCSLNCGIQSETIVCRGPSEGTCDVADVCDGINPTCTDRFQPADVECRPKSGDCDIPDFCSGTGPDCPADQVVPAGTVCRPEANPCDLLEACDGLSPICPPDLHKNPFSPCSPPQSDLLCSGSSYCSPGSECVPDVLPDGQTCGTFCDNSTCQQGKCVLKSGTHPCGSKDLCDASHVGMECTKCGDGNLDPWEECDPGAALKMGPTEGCTQYCQAACGSSHPCAPPLLAVNTTDPCRASECQPVNPKDPKLGSACVTKTLGCSACLDDLDCPPASCKRVHCDVENRICQEEEEDSGFEYYTCALVPSLTHDNCPKNSLKRPLKVITRQYERARSLATKARSVCQSDGGKESQAILRRAKERLEVAILQVVVLGFGHRGLAQCVDEVSIQLEQRAGRIRDHLKLADVRAACTGRPFANPISLK
jgi:hypothetical protein